MIATLISTASRRRRYSGATQDPMRTYVRGGADGFAYTRLRLALRHGNLVAVRANAAELRRIELVDALAIAELIYAKDSERFDAAAVRWAARLGFERQGVAAARALARGAGARRAA